MAIHYFQQYETTLWDSDSVLPSPFRPSAMVLIGAWNDVTDMVTFSVGLIFYNTSSSRQTYRDSLSVHQLLTEGPDVVVAESIAGLSYEWMQIPFNGATNQTDHSHALGRSWSTATDLNDHFFRTNGWLSDSSVVARATTMTRAAFNRIPEFALTYSANYRRDGSGSGRDRELFSMQPPPRATRPAPTRQRLGRLNFPAIQAPPPPPPTPVRQSLGRLNFPARHEKQRLGRLSFQKLSQRQRLGRLNFPARNERQDLGRLSFPEIKGGRQNLGRLNFPARNERQLLGRLSFPSLALGPLDTPANLRSLIATVGTIIMQWNPVNGASGYELQWGKVGGSLSSSASIGTSQIFRNLEADTEYRFRVQARASGRESSAYSDWVVVSTQGNERQTLGRLDFPALATRQRLGRLDFPGLERQRQRLGRLDFPGRQLLGRLNFPGLDYSVLWEMRRYDSSEWININEHIATPGTHREGRDPETLGGGSPISQPSSMSVGLHGIEPEPGDWLRCTYGAPSTLRFLGALADIQPEDEFGVQQTEWYGPMWGMTADHGSGGVLQLDRTLQQIMDDFTRTTDVPNRILGTLKVRDGDGKLVDATFNRVIRLGVEGLHDVEQMSGGFAYDLTDGNVVLELPSVREDMEVVRTTDEPAAKVVRHSNAFGVVNHVDVILRHQTPIEADPDVTFYHRTFQIPVGSLAIPIVGEESEERITLNQDDLFVSPAVVPQIAPQVQFYAEGENIGAPVGVGDSSRTASITVGGRTIIYTVRVKDLVAEVRGSLIIIDFKYMAFAVTPDAQVVESDILVGGTVRVSAIHQLFRETRDFPFPVDDATSKRRYKRRSYPPIVVGSRAISPLAKDYVVTPTTAKELVDLGRKVIRGHQVKPSYETVTDDLTEISERRISDRETIPFTDKNGVTTIIDGHVEAYENTVSNNPVQRFWITPREFAIGLPNILGEA